MTAKTKRGVLIAVAVLSVAMVMIIIVGVMSLFKSSTFKGSISFISSDIQATIAKASVSGGEISKDKMQQINVDGLITENQGIKTWEDLDFKLSKDSKDIEIRFNIINHSTEKTLKVSLGDVNGKMNNASVDIKFDGMDSTIKTAYIAKAKISQQGEIVEENFKQVVIILRVDQKYKDATIKDLNIPIALLSVDAHVINVANMCDDEINTLVHTDINTVGQKLDRSLELCGNDAIFTNQSEFTVEYRFIINNGTPTIYTAVAGGGIRFSFEGDSNVAIVEVVKVV